MQVFSTLFKSEILSFSTNIFIGVAKTNKNIAKANHIVQFIRQAVGLSVHILNRTGSESKENL